MKLEIGKYYYVWDNGGTFWMVGKVIRESNYPDSLNPTIANIISPQHSGEFVEGCNWATHSPSRAFRDATPEEIYWLDTCIQAGKYLQKPKIQEYEIY